MPTYFVAIDGKALWVATMPNGTADRAFAELVAKSIAGASVVCGQVTAPFTPPSLLSMPYSSAEECCAQQEIAYMAYCDERDRFEVSLIQAARNRSKSHPLSANRAERRRVSRSL